MTNINTSFTQGVIASEAVGEAKQSLKDCFNVEIASAKNRPRNDTRE